MSQIKTLIQALEQGDQSITDDALMEAVANLHAGGHNVNAAEFLLQVVAPLGAHRSYLAVNLLPEILQPLHTNGLETAEDVFRWVRRHLENPTDYPDATPSGMAWLAELMTHPDDIQLYLDHIGQANAEWYIEETRERFARYSQIPVERVNFMYRWRENLDEFTGILFFELSDGGGEDEDDDAAPTQADHEALRYDESRDYRNFRYLTGALAKLDPTGSVRLMVFDDDVHLDVCETKDTLFGQSVAETQTYWLANGELLHSARADLTDFNVLVQYTLDLIRQLKS